MPSGAKKRRAAKRKKQEEALLHTKQPDDVTGSDGNVGGNEEFTSVSILKLTIPIEELAKGAVFHNEAKCGGMASEVEVLSSDEAAPVDKDLEVTNQPIEVSSKSEVATDESAVGGNENSLFEAISNEENTMSNDEQVLSEKEESFLKIKSNEDIVVSKDERVEPENVGCIETVESLENLKEESIGVVSKNSKETEGTSKYPVQYDGIPEQVNDTVQLVSGLSNDSKEADMATEFLEQLTFRVPEEIIEFAPWLSGVSNFSDAAENTSMFRDLPVERREELGVTQLASAVNDVPSLNEVVKDNAPPPENSGCSSAEPPCAVSPAIENHTFVACPLHCSAKCSFPQLLLGQPDVEVTARKEDFEQMTRVKELDCALHSLKAALLIALDKLNAVANLAST